MSDMVNVNPMMDPFQTRGGRTEIGDGGCLALLLVAASWGQPSLAMTREANKGLDVAVERLGATTDADQMLWELQIQLVIQQKGDNTRKAAMTIDKIKIVWTGRHR